MDESTRPQVAARELGASIQRALDEIRFRNARAVALLRVVIRVATLAVFGAAWLRGSSAIGVPPALGTAVSAAHLAVGAGILLWLRRRPTVLAVGLGAASDLIGTATSTLVALGSAGVDAGYVLGVAATVLQVLLLFDALTMSRRMLAGYASAAWLIAAAAAARAHLPFTDSISVLLLLGLFSAAISLAGARILELVVRASVETLAAELARRNAEELAAAYAALQAAQREAEALTHLIVHDLRNPLASIWANLEEVRGSIPETAAPAQEAVDVAVSELRRAADMTSDLLLVSRLERRDFRPLAPVPIARLLGEVEHSFRAVLGRVGASLAVRIAPAAPGEAVLDEALVRRLLDNLLANAARHVARGDRVELAAEADGAGLRLAVRNSGPPIAPEVAANLFEKHASGGAQRRADNSGLGLYLCRLVAERHGGTIRLAARDGWSVSFEAVFPPAGPAA